MKIAIVTSRYPSAEKPYNHMFVHVRVHEFIKQNHQVKVFVPSEINSTTVYEGVSVHRTTSKEIIEDLSFFDISYLHLVNLYPFKKSNGWTIYKYLINSKSPFAIYIHGNEVQKYTSRMYEYNFSIRETLKWIKKDFYVIPKMKRFVSKTAKNPNNTFIFPSNWMKEEAERNLKYKIDNYKIIPNGIDLQLFEYSNQTKRRNKLVTIRSLSQKVYHIEFSIRIMKELPKNYTLDIYGKGIYTKKYQNLINRLGLKNRIRIINDFFEKKEMKNLFKEYGGYLSTTRMDSQGITMLEAMACGLVVISTDNSSRREFIEDLKTGILGQNPKELAFKIEDIFKNESSYEIMAKNGAEKIKKLNNRITIKKEIDVLQNLILFK